MTGRVTVTVVETRGSAPRDAGTWMTVDPDGQTGTIGGGALEFEATRIARDMINSNADPQRRNFPLGPSLGQCCGGHVVLDFSPGEARNLHNSPPLWVWGAGHVGRAIVSTMAPLKDRSITWVDTGPGRFPDDLPCGVHPLAATDPLRVVTRAPENAAHVIVTYSHDLDLSLCDALLSHGFGFAGLIGSDTKKARFARRLGDFGHSIDEIARINCPIGRRELGKHPQAIAIGVASQLMTLPATAELRGENAI